jgi:hypothetical protein
MVQRTKVAKNVPDFDTSVTPGNTVTVGCKLPNGIIMQLSKMEPTREPTAMGFRDIEIGRKVGKAVKIRGFATPFGMMPRSPIIGGYALTPGVDRDLFDEWMKQNADSELVKNELIFAHRQRSDVEVQARDNAKEKSGLEPMDPNAPPREMKGKIMPATTNVEDEMIA